MTASKPITLRFEQQDYERLKDEAKRLGLSPSELARIFIRAGLGEGTREPERQRQEGLGALDRLAALTDDLPLVDAVQIARESREALEQRSTLT